MSYGTFGATAEAINVFGLETFFASDETETSNNSDTVWANKVTLSSPSLTLGSYLLSFQFIWRSDTANREADFRVLLNGSPLVQWTPSISRTQENQLLSGFRRTDNLSGTNTWQFQFKGNRSNSTIFVREARLFVWRVNP